MNVMGFELDCGMDALPEGLPKAIEQQRSQAFRSVSDGVPKNDYGLPVFILRPDLIPEDIESFSAEEKAQVLSGAAIDILYDEGFPTFTDGTAFWSQMPFEPVEAYDAFKIYLEMGEKSGARRIEDLFYDIAANEQQSSLALLNGNARKQIRDYYIYYNWAIRCKAYDLFRVAAYHKLRERRILSTTDQHFLQAEKLFGKLLGYFDKVDDDGDVAWLKELSPKVAIDMLDKLAKLQRTSIGLSAHGHAAGDSGSNVSKNADVEVVLRQIASGAQDPNARESDTNKTDLSVLLNDPETAMMAQELVIKVGEANRKD